MDGAALERQPTEIVQDARHERVIVAEKQAIAPERFAEQRLGFRGSAGEVQRPGEVVQRLGDERMIVAERFLPDRERFAKRGFSFVEFVLIQERAREPRETARDVGVILSVQTTIDLERLTVLRFGAREVAILTGELRETGHGLGDPRVAIRIKLPGRGQRVGVHRPGRGVFALEEQRGTESVCGRDALGRRRSLQIGAQRGRSLQQIDRGIVQTQSRVDAPHRLQQSGLHDGLCREIAIDAGRAAVEDLAGGHRGTARFVRIDDLKQLHEKFAGLKRRGGFGLGLRALPLGLVARHDGHGREHRGDAHADHRRDADRDEPAVAALQLASSQLVEPDADETGDELQQRRARPVLAGPKVRADRLRDFRAACVLRQRLAERGREAVLGAGGLGRAADDQAEDLVRSPQAPKHADLFVHPAGSRGGGRANHDHRGRLLERRVHDAAQVRRGRQLLAIAEHRSDARGHCAGATLLTDEPARDRIALERLVKPARPTLVAVAVADERAIANRLNGGVGHVLLVSLSGDLFGSSSARAARCRASRRTAR